MRILGLHDGSGCGYYRVWLPLNELSKHGHEVTFVDQFKEPEIMAKELKRSEEYDLIVGERLISYDHVSGWRRSRGSSNRLVYENDDDVFNISVENWIAYNLYKKADVREAVAA